MSRGEHTDLIVWKKSMNLVDEIYSYTKKFPKDELFGLTSQVRRAGCSIPLNIAEGNGRRTDNDFKKFLNIAYTSCLEVETAIHISERQNCISKEIFESLLLKSAEVKKLLSGLINSIK